jgi:hypothetical protein
MSKNSALDLVAEFMGRQNSIPVPVAFVRLTGDYTAAAFLAQCFYWTTRTDDAGGWFHKSHEEWADELLLSADQVRRCVRSCGDMIEVRRAGVPARNHYRTNREAVAEALQHLADEKRNATARCGETQYLEVDKPHDKSRTNPTTSRTADPTSNKGTETTAETTSERTDNSNSRGGDQHRVDELAIPVSAAAAGPALENEAGGTAERQGAERAGNPDGSQGAPGLTVSGEPDLEPAAETIHATGTEQVPGAAAGAALAALQGVLAPLVAVEVIAEVGPRSGWLQLTPARIRELHTQAWQAHGNRRYRGALIELLDDELRQAPSATAEAPPPAPGDEIDMDALIRGAPLNPVRRTR